MNRDDLIGQLASCVGQGMRVPDEAFRLAASIDLERFNGMSVHSAALSDAGRPRSASSV